MGFHLHLRPSMIFLFLLAINIILIHVQISVFAIDEQYQNCSAPFRCANIDNIGYPFWGGNRPQNCGYPGFGLNCSGDVPEISIMDLTYKVLNINNTLRVVTVAREDYWDDICPSNLVNTSINLSLFNYTSGTDSLMLYYSCPVNLDFPGTLNRFQFNCSSDETNTLGNYFFSWDVKNNFNASFIEAMKAYFGSCANRVEIPLQQPKLESMVNNPAPVNLTEALKAGFGLQWFVNNSLCDVCKRSAGRCGYSARTGEFSCYCRDKSYPDSCPSRSGSGTKISIIAGIMAAGIIVILAILLIVCLGRFWKKKTERGQNIFCLGRFQENTEDDRNMEAAFIRNYGSLAPKRYNYSDIKMMTKSFNHKLGQGGYGDVYKGKLPDGRLVAVKVLKNLKGNGEEFINEVASISRTSHVNIVTFLGFCYEKKKRALIYEFMPNGSLDQFINDQDSSNTNRKLEWRTMYQIAVGIARGLEYLHRGCNIRIVHFDIKPHNILLDEDFCPKVSDFGLAKQSQKKESIISMLEARGTIGYIAPEVFCRTFGGVSHKSDVYSYGMMILEMVVGRKNDNANVSRSSELYFPNAIYENIEPGNDFQLDGVVTEEEKEMAKKMILVSLWCIQTNPSDRPSMHKVLEMLEASIENLQIPPKPSLSSPRRSTERSAAAASMSTYHASQESSGLYETI